MAEMESIGELCQLINGYAFKPSDWSSEGTPIVRIQNLNNILAEFNYFKGNLDKKYYIDNGALLFSWSGTPGTSFGAFIWNRGPAIINQHIFRVIPKKEINLFYLKYALNGKLSDIIAKSHGGVGLQHITKKDLEKINISVPSLNIQNKIVMTLNSLENVLEKRKQQLSKLDQLVKSRFIEMFGDPVKNPYNWNTTSLNALGELNRGVSKHRPRNAPELLNGKYPLIQTGDIASSDLYITKYSSTYSEFGLKQSRMWPVGTLCITIAANIAKTSILKFDACFPDSVVGFISGKDYIQVFIHFWFSFFQKILEEQAPESAQKNINLKILNELKVISPPNYLQKSFFNFVQQIERSKSSVKQSLNTLETLKKSLMHEYFG